MLLGAWSGVINTSSGEMKAAVESCVEGDAAFLMTAWYPGFKAS